MLKAEKQHAQRQNSKPMKIKTSLIALAVLAAAFSIQPLAFSLFAAADPLPGPSSPAVSILQPLFDLLGGKGTWLITVITWFGTLSAILAPFSVWIQHRLTDWLNTAAASSETDDDQWLRNLYGNPLYRFVATALRFIHLRLPTLADLERALQLQQDAVAKASQKDH